MAINPVGEPRSALRRQYGSGLGNAPKEEQFGVGVAYYAAPQPKGLL